MKFLPPIVALVLGICALPTLAEDHAVSGEALRSVGLAGLNVVPAERGASVRGKFSYSFASSLTIVSGAMRDPDSGTNMQYNTAQFGSQKTFSPYSWPPSAASAYSKAKTDYPIVMDAGHFWGSAWFSINGSAIAAGAVP